MALRRTVSYTQYRGNRLVDRPPFEPVTVSDVQAQAVIDGDDDLVKLYIEAARDYIESVTGLAFLTQTWQMTIDHWPNSATPWWDGVRDGSIADLYSKGRKDDVVLPRYPLQDVTEITADGQSVAVSDVFIVDTQQQPGRLVIKRGATWPVVVDQSANGIQITYIAGFSSNPEEVPAPLRLAIIQMAANLYQHRGDECSTQDAYTMSGAKSLVETYRQRTL